MKITTTKTKGKYSNIIHDRVDFVQTFPIAPPDDSEETAQEFTITFDADVAQAVRDELPLLLASRDIDSMPGYSSAVSVMAKRRAKSSGRKKESLQDVSSVISQLETMGSRAEDAALKDMLLLKVMDTPDMFHADRIGAGVAVTILPPFQHIEIDPDYFAKRNKKTDMEQLLVHTGHYTAQKPKYDDTNPLEIMIAYVHAVLDAYPEIEQFINEHVTGMLFGVMYGEVRKADSLNFLHQAMDVLLSEDMAQVDEDEHGADAGARTRHNSADSESD